MLTKWRVYALFLLAPIIGFTTGFYQSNPAQGLEDSRLEIPVEKSNDHIQQIMNKLEETDDVIVSTANSLDQLKGTATKESKEYEQQNSKINALLATSQSQLKKSGDVLDQILSKMLGNPIGQSFTTNATVKVYSLEESGYSGYMAKVRLKDPNALKVVLANDKLVSKGETTSHAGSRKGAILAVNAGGFNYGPNGNLSPIGITVIDGQIRTFSDNKNVSFVGFNNQGRLVGGKIHSQAELKQKGILQGASFLPTLLQGGKKQPIPSQWANTRHPRTLIGHFDNGDLLFIVIDGRGYGGSKGVTLEEAQRKLLEFHVRDAYNLDGGGSSAFYYKGKILNHPSDGRERKVISNIVVLP
ncbi:phosphodiester glycosidase family protein [Brevibacillus ginsengisoli]|uniref:phosphodiester glycosidase family protein n=1 Tax=Brevibacillus ginsengisoli TaxID=363854 RepID=UPI003CFB79F5